MTEKLTMDVVVVGSFMTDFYCYCFEFPKPGETVRGNNFQQGFGGKGANQCVMASAMGAKVAMVGRVGTDQFGTNYVNHLNKNNISTAHVKITENSHTGIASITVNERGQNNIIIIPGANNKLNIEDVKACLPIIKTSKVLMVQLETPVEATIQALKLARTHGVISILNASPGQANLDREIFLNADYICVNETEAELLVGLTVDSVADAKKAAPLFLEKGCTNVIITLGALGSVFCRKGNNNVVHVPACPVTAVDTTGAGDSFLGSLAYYLSCHHKLDLSEIIRRSSKIASICVQKQGTQSSFPTKEQLPAELFS
ncbi:ribokinase-like [Argonauta hians]